MSNQYTGGRRLPLAPLLAATGATSLSDLARRCSVAVRQMQRYKAAGVPEDYADRQDYADRLAVKAGHHPGEVWPVVRGGVVKQPRLTVVPSELGEANAFVSQHHRHHDPVIGHKFSIAVADDAGVVHGVVIVGRPTSRRRQDGWTLEVTRLATDGTPNACSALYAAAWRAAKSQGYRRLGTYILDSEPGTSLIAAGWHLVHSTPGRSWDVPSRPRVDKHPLQGRLLWEAS